MNSPPINLLPNATDNIGSVFITLEPTVLQDGTNKTNFPLFVMVDSLPSSRSQIELDESYFSMRNWTGSVDASRGFPKVKVSIERF
ncbi:MAG: hypothetical protein U9N54_12025, partial [candidate division Zixibacteria bacterium]|nr:hypothetical protein [candidate division Zixibacteria bacterium]